MANRLSDDYLNRGARQSAPVVDLDNVNNQLNNLNNGVSTVDSDVDQVSRRLDNLSYEIAEKTEKANNHLISRFIDTSRNIFGNVTSTFGASIKSAFADVIEEIKPNREGLGARMGASVLGPIGLVLGKSLANSGLAERIKMGLSDAIANMRDRLANSMDRNEQQLEDVEDAISNQYSGLRDNLNENWNRHEGELSSHFDTIQDSINRDLDEVKNVVSGSNEAVANEVSDVSKNIHQQTGALAEELSNLNGNVSDIATAMTDGSFTESIAQAFKKQSASPDKKTSTTHEMTINDIAEILDSTADEIHDDMSKLHSGLTSISESLFDVLDTINLPPEKKKPMWKGMLPILSPIFSGPKYVSDIKKSENPYVSIIDGIVHIYRFQRLYGEVTFRQLNELIQTQGGRPQRMIGKLSFIREFVAKNRLLLDAKIQQKRQRDLVHNQGKESAIAKVNYGLWNFFGRFLEDPEILEDKQRLWTENALIGAMNGMARDADRGIKMPGWVMANRFFKAAGPFAFPNIDVDEETAGIYAKRMGYYLGQAHSFGMVNPDTGELQFSPEVAKKVFGLGIFGEHPEDNFVRTSAMEGVTNATIHPMGSNESLATESSKLALTSSVLSVIITGGLEPVTTLLAVIIDICKQHFGMNENMQDSIADMIFRNARDDDEKVNYYITAETLTNQILDQVNSIRKENERQATIAQEAEEARKEAEKKKAFSDQFIPKEEDKSKTFSILGFIGKVMAAIPLNMLLALGTLATFLIINPKKTIEALKWSFESKGNFAKAVLMFTKYRYSVLLGFKIIKGTISVLIDVFKVGASGLSKLIRLGFSRLGSRIAKLFKPVTMALTKFGRHWFGWIPRFFNYLNVLPTRIAKAMKIANLETAATVAKSANKAGVVARAASAAARAYGSARIGGRLIKGAKATGSAMGIWKSLGVAGSVGVKALARGGIKAALQGVKLIPGVGQIIGSLFSFFFAWQKFKTGDKKGGWLDIASGLTNLIPGIGPVISLLIDMVSMTRDIKGSRTSGKYQEGGIGRHGYKTGDRIADIFLDSAKTMNRSFDNTMDVWKEEVPGKNSDSIASDVAKAQNEKEWEKRQQRYHEEQDYLDEHYKAHDWLSNDYDARNYFRENMPGSKMGNWAWTKGDVEWAVKISRERQIDPRQIVAAWEDGVDGPGLKSLIGNNVKAWEKIYDLLGERDEEGKRRYAFKQIVDAFRLTKGKVTGVESFLGKGFDSLSNKDKKAVIEDNLFDLDSAAVKIVKDHSTLDAMRGEIRASNPGLSKEEIDQQAQDRLSALANTYINERDRENRLKALNEYAEKAKAADKSFVSSLVTEYGFEYEDAMAAYKKANGDRSKTLDILTKDMNQEFLDPRLLNLQRYYKYASEVGLAGYQADDQWNRIVKPKLGSVLEGEDFLNLLPYFQTDTGLLTDKYWVGGFGRGGPGDKDAAGNELPGLYSYRENNADQMVKYLRTRDSFKDLIRNDEDEKKVKQLIGSYGFSIVHLMDTLHKTPDELQKYLTGIKEGQGKSPWANKLVALLAKAKTEEQRQQILNMASDPNHNYTIEEIDHIVFGTQITDSSSEDWFEEDKKSKLDRLTREQEMLYGELDILHEQIRKYQEDEKNNLLNEQDKEFYRLTQEKLEQVKKRIEENENEVGRLSTYTPTAEAIAAAAKEKKEGYDFSEASPQTSAVAAAAQAVSEQAQKSESQAAENNNVPVGVAAVAKETQETQASSSTASDVATATATPINTIKNKNQESIKKSEVAEGVTELTPTDTKKDDSKEIINRYTDKLEDAVSKLRDKNIECAYGIGYTNRDSIHSDRFSYMDAQDDVGARLSEYYGKSKTVKIKTKNGYINKTTNEFSAGGFTDIYTKTIRLPDGRTMTAVIRARTKESATGIGKLNEDPSLIKYGEKLGSQESSQPILDELKNIDITETKPSESAARTVQQIAQEAKENNIQPTEASLSTTSAVAEGVSEVTPDQSHPKTTEPRAPLTIKEVMEGIDRDTADSKAIPLSELADELRNFTPNIDPSTATEKDLADLFYKICFEAGRQGMHYQDAEDAFNLALKKNGIDWYNISSGYDKQHERRVGDFYRDIGLYDSAGNYHIPWDKSITQVVRLNSDVELPPEVISAIEQSHQHDAESIDKNTLAKDFSLLHRFGPNYTGAAEALDAGSSAAADVLKPTLAPQSIVTLAKATEVSHLGLDADNNGWWDGSRFYQLREQYEKTLAEDAEYQRARLKEFIDAINEYESGSSKDYAWLFDIDRNKKYEEALPLLLAAEELRKKFASDQPSFEKYYKHLLPESSKSSVASSISTSEPIITTPDTSSVTSFTTTTEPVVSEAIQQPTITESVPEGNLENKVMELEQQKLTTQKKQAKELNSETIKMYMKASSAAGNGGNTLVSAPQLIKGGNTTINKSEVNNFGVGGLGYMGMMGGGGGGGGDMAGDFWFNIDDKDFASR